MLRVYSAKSQFKLNFKDQADFFLNLNADLFL